MTEKRFRMEIIEEAILPFIVDNSTAKKQNDKITSYKTYETYRKDKCLELVNLLNELNDEKIELKKENEQLKKEIMEWKDKYFYSEETVINEYSSNISKDMEELQKEVYGDVE